MNTRDLRVIKTKRHPWRFSFTIANKTARKNLRHRVGAHRWDQQGHLLSSLPRYLWSLPRPALWGARSDRWGNHIFRSVFNRYWRFYAAIVLALIGQSVFSEQPFLFSRKRAVFARCPALFLQQTLRKSSAGKCFRKHSRKPFEAYFFLCRSRHPAPLSWRKIPGNDHCYQQAGLSQPIHKVA